MGNAFSDYFLPITLAIITLGMGLSISHADFRRVFYRPRAVIVGILAQIFLLPSIAFTIAFLTDLHPYFKIGLVIIAACPGGATSNLVTYLLKGNVALSISMTGLNSLITLISIPVTISIALMAFLHTEANIKLDVWDTVSQVFLLTVVPAYIGMTIRHKKPEFADKLNHPLRYILPITLLLVYLGVLFIDEGMGSASQGDFIKLLPVAFVLNTVAVGLGWLIARISKLKKRDQFTISIEVGLQNSALAIFVASTLLGNSKMALVAVIYGSFTFFSTAFYAWGIKKLTTESKRSSEF